MKRIIIVCCMVICSKLSFGQGRSVRVMHLINKMTQLQQKDYYLEAMDSALLALTLAPENRIATDFVYKHWDLMMRSTLSRLEELPYDDDEELDDAIERVNIYRNLVEIQDYLKQIPLPLHGERDSWVWQPEVQYWDGALYEAQKQQKKIEKLIAEEEAAAEKEGKKAPKGEVIDEGIEDE